MVAQRVAGINRRHLYTEIIVNANLVLDGPKLIHCLMQGGHLVGESSNNEVL